MQAPDAEAITPFWLTEHRDTHGIPPRRRSSFQMRNGCSGINIVMTVGRADGGECDVIDRMVPLRKGLTLPGREGS